MLNVSLWGALLLAVVISQVANLATTLYLHRSLTHRAITMKPWLTMVFRTVLWLATGLDRREWVAVHRKHHAFSDEAGDPHSPVQFGVWKVFGFNAEYYRRAAKLDGTIETYGKDLPPDRWERLVFRRGVVGLTLGVAALVLLFGPLMAVVIGVVHAVLYLSQGGMVNSFGHHFGKRRHGNRATNLRWLALITAGEGMHNEHHEFPRSPYFGDTWWDLGGKTANGFAKLGWLELHKSTRRLRQVELSMLQEELPQPEPVTVG